MQKVVFFAHFPFDFRLCRPVSLGYGVDLVDASPPRSLLDHRLEVLVVPEDAAGTGQVHVCMQAEITGAKVNADNRLWRALSSIQLAGRLHWRATGAVTVDMVGLRIVDAQIFRSETAGVGREIAFTESEWRDIRTIHIRVARLGGKGLERVRSGFTLWSQIACGACSSWQLALIGLIACLECFFPQPKNPKYDSHKYGSRLSVRVQHFLAGNGFTNAMRIRLNRVYDRYRNSIAHGVHDPFRQGLKVSRRADFEFIFEAARLVILGILGFSNADLRRLLPLDAGWDATQQGIDRLGKAPQALLKNRTFGKYSGA